MTLTLGLGRAPTFVIEKFDEFKSIYSSITAAICSLLEKDCLLTKKYRFCQSNGKYEEWEVLGTAADTEISLQQVASRLDSYVQYSRLDSRAAAVEELLLSPKVTEIPDVVSDGESSVDEAVSADASNAMDEDFEGVDINLGEGNLQDDDESGLKKSSRDKKKKRKSRKPKKHKKKHYDDYSGEEDDGKRKRHPRDVWRRVGSKFIGWYTCIRCNKKLKNEEEYMKHIDMHGDTHSPACMDCGNYFGSMKAYEEHIGNLGKELSYRCEEDGCGRAFQFKCRLECHRRTHAGELMYECNDCGHKLSSIRSIIRHTRAKHLNEKPFRCHMCDKAFAIQSQLTRHIKDHISPPHYTCELCGRTFSSRQGHHYHQLDHLGVKPHKCSVCEKAFRNKTDMINHERIHSGDRPFTCELCGKSFVEKGALRKHRVVHTREKNFVCSNCGKQFGYKCSLDGHLKKCQQDLHNSSLLSMSSLVSQPVHTPLHDKPLQIVEDTPSTTQSDIAVATTAQDHSRNRNMYLTEFTTTQHDSMAKNHRQLSHNNEDLLATVVHKGQQEASRLVKKNPPYRPMPNLTHNVNKQAFIDKHMQDAPMYPGYPMQLTHQRETIDPDLLASVLGQKLPLQVPMQYTNERVPRDEPHTTHYRGLAQQEREPSHIMDGPPPAGPAASAYNPHRHPQHPPSSISDSMMFQHQVRGHHFRP